MVHRSSAMTRRDIIRSDFEWGYKGEGLKIGKLNVVWVYTKGSFFYCVASCNDFKNVEASRKTLLLVTDLSMVLSGILMVDSSSWMTSSWSGEKNCLHHDSYPYHLRWSSSHRTTRIRTAPANIRKIFSAINGPKRSKAARLDSLSPELFMAPPAISANLQSGKPRPFPEKVRKDGGSDSKVGFKRDCCWDTVVANWIAKIIPERINPESLHFGFSFGAEFGFLLYLFFIDFAKVFYSVDREYTYCALRRGRTLKALSG